MDGIAYLEVNRIQMWIGIILIVNYMQVVKKYSQLIYNITQKYIKVNKNVIGDWVMVKNKVNIYFDESGKRKKMVLN